MITYLLTTGFWETVEPYAEILLDSLLDCLKMLPFIFLTYVIIELVERRVSFAKNGKFLTGRAAPVFGALAGVFPQCGISVMSAKLFDRDIIAVGTLLSVFVATSDEAFSILVSSGKWLSLGLLVAFKISFAIIIGVVANAIFRKKITYDVGEFNHEEICAHCHDHVDADDDDHGKKAIFQRYFAVPFLHSLQTFLYVFAVTFVFGLFFGEGGIIGAEKFEAYLSATKYFEPFLTAAIGLIPNCASSAIITTAYINGAISFGSMLGGLISNAGVGLAVLFRNTGKIKRNLLILLTLYLAGAIVGLAVSAVFGAIGITI